MFLNEIEELQLSDNDISYFNPNWFVNKHNLKILELRKNCLHNFDFDAFPINNVINFQLNGNYLREISITGLKKSFPFVKYFFFDHNNFNCSHLREIVDSDVGNNVKIWDVSTKIPNINGIECHDDEAVDVHKLENKCKLSKIPEFTTAT